MYSQFETVWPDLRDNKKQMTLLVFPFLLLTRRGFYRSTTIGDGTVHALAFTSTKKAGAFMDASGESNWEFALIVRSGLHPVINDLEAANLVGICMDPDPDETGGTSIKVAELSAIANA